MTGIATVIYENQASEAVAGETERHLAAMGRELKGAEGLTGTYPFDLARSVKAYRLNKFLHSLIAPAQRQAFVADEDALMAAAGLTEEEQRLVKARDWRGLIHYGVIFFMLEKLGAVIGTSNLHIYAAMRGESLADFQKTRNAPNALYSVAGKDAAPLAWNT